MAEFNSKADIIMVDYWEKRRFPKRVNLELSRESLKSILQFYPEFRIIFVTDYSHEDELNKIRDIDSEFIYIPDLGNYPLCPDFGAGHGIGLDEGVQHVKSEYFFSVDRDTLMLKKGWPEILVSHLNNKIQAVGPGMNNKASEVWNGRSFITPYFSVFKTEPVKKFHLSFCQVYFKNLLFSTGQFLCYRLASLGFDFQVKNLGEFNEYIKHHTGIV